MSDIWQEPDGTFWVRWYDDSAEGPYRSREEAEAILTRLVDWLNRRISPVEWAG